jgi:diguanylate cyclase (GGDEF)-like protein
MTRQRRSSIRHTLWFGTVLAVLLTAAGAVLIYAHQLQQARRGGERLRILAMAETCAAQLNPLARGGLRSDVVTLVNGLTCHPATSLVAVLDLSGAVIVARGNTALIEEYVQPSATTASSAASAFWQVPGDPDHRMPAQSLAAVPLRDPQTQEPLAVLVYAARVSSDDHLDWRRVWPHLSCLLGASALGVAFGSFWLARHILGPLRDLAARSSPPALAADDRLPATLIGRPDEIGDLSRDVADLCDELRRVRGRVDRLERSVDHRVAEQTQRITRELRQAEKKVWTDALTRLGSRRLMEDKFDEIFRSQVEARQDLSVVLIDLDYFKEVNDTLGHKAGDQVLVFAGELLRQCLRDQDLAIRYGGDEFILILPSVSAANAQSIADRTVRLFNQQVRTLNLEPPPSMSAGIASLRSHNPKESRTLLDLADEALYQAKRSGKSRVCIARSTALAAGR